MKLLPRTLAVAVLAAFATSAHAEIAIDVIGNSEVSFEGLFQADGNWFDNDVQDLNGSTGNDGKDSEFELRRAEVILKGKGTSWDWVAGYDAKANKFLDTNIRYKMGVQYLQLGQYKQPNSLEELSSTRYNDFISKSMTTNLFGVARLGCRSQVALEVLERGVNLARSEEDVLDDIRLVKTRQHILAVADTYDTLRSDRPFRPAKSVDEAREVLQEGAGTQFDPNVVSVFLKRLAGLEAQVEAQGLGYTDRSSLMEEAVSVEAEDYIEQIKLANKEVFTLYELAREFGSSANLDEMLALFSDHVRRLVPFDTCVVYLLDASKRSAKAAHVSGDNSEILAERHIKVGKGATGIALKRRQMVKNVNPDLDFSLSHLELIQQYSTMAALPLIADDEIVGAVSIYSNDLPEYDEEHLRLLETVSRIAAEAIGKTQEHAEAKANALTDPMTGLPNARSLQFQFEKELGRASRSGSTFQVLVMDLDGFKAVNDNFGHIAGDEMLREVGAVIQAQLRDYDFLARYGGDEFVALIPDAEYGDVTDLCGRIESAVSAFKLPVGDDKFASVGVSLGSAGYPANGVTFDELIIAADKAMYLQKSARKRESHDLAMHERATLSDVLKTETVSRGPLPDSPPNEHFIIELDESHVISSAIN